MKKTITAHCLVKNEERFLWYAVMSIYNFVDEILLWDTGSTDGTQEVIKRLREIDANKKIQFREYGEVSKETFTKARQDMLEATDTDWFLMLDGDEIWWEDSIKKLVEEVDNSDNNQWESIIVPTYNLVGDFYHYLPDDAGFYKFRHSTGQVKGHYNLRAINNKIVGLHSEGIHGVWGWADKDNKQIQDRDPQKIKLLNAPYLHATFLQRAKTREDERQVPKRSKKLKYELGEEFPYDFYYPEVFFRNRPEIIPSIWNKIDFKYKFKASWETPLRKIKRKIYIGRAGY